MIKLDRINKYFYRGKKNSLHVINDTSLTFNEHGLVAILGPSGSGKTTLLNVIGGLDSFNTGSLYIDGKRITGSSKKVDKIRNLLIGYIFQDYKLIDDMSVFDNVAITLKMCGIKDKKKINERVSYVLNVLDLYRYRKRPVSMLSGGERQRVGIARAIAKNPEIVICDEPTGNLDSKNSIEIMNIIKCISKERLVILVTHEVELAKFYADRIIEIEDGVVKKDYENEGVSDLDYQMDNKLYLKDFKNHTKLSKEGITLNYFSNEKNEIDINLIVRGNNVFIETSHAKSVELVDENSSYEVIDDHYKKIDKSIYEKYEFKMNEFKNKKYSSIYNIFSMLKVGLEKVSNYKLMKKVSLLCVAISAGLILYNLANIFGVSNINKNDYLKNDPSYISVTIKKNKLDAYQEIKNMDGVVNILPNVLNTNLILPINFYFQASDEVVYLSDTGLATKDVLSDEDILFGSKTNESNEILIDKEVYEQTKLTSSYGIGGILSEEDLIGKEIKLSNNKRYKITGITNKSNPSIYFNSSETLNFITEKYDIFSDVLPDETEAKGYNELKDEISIVKGREPLNEWEVIVPYSKRYEYRLYSKLPKKLMGERIKVVGYYRSKKYQNKILNSETLFKFYINESDTFYISSKDKESLKSNLDEKYKYKDIEENSYKEYMSERKEYISSTIMISSIFLVITLLLVYLLVRASFLSRVKEVGILRAIGVKKSDIYRMFAGEIIVMTIIGGVVGIFIIYRLIKAITMVSILSSQFMVNIPIAILAFAILFFFHLFVGLIPVFFTIRKTPASILSRKDI